MTEISKNIVDAYYQLRVKRKISLIMKSKATIEPQVSFGKIIGVYSNTGMGEKGKFPTPKIVFSVDTEARNALVPAQGGNSAIVAILDVLLELPEEFFANLVQMAIDTVDHGIDN